MMESYTVIEQETDKVKGIDVLKSGTYIPHEGWLTNSKVDNNNIIVQERLIMFIHSST